MKKQVLSGLLVLCLIFSLLPVSAFADEATASGTCGENLTWTLDSEGTLTISGTGAMTNYYYSTAPWYSSRSSIKSVTIGNGVTSIGYDAFSGCSSLTSVTIPGSVTSIEEWTFSHCRSLTNIKIGNGVTSIGEGAFFGCVNLTSVALPESVTTIEKDAFGLDESGSNIKYVYYDGDIESWLKISFPDHGANPCRGNTNLYFKGELATDIVIPDNVTSIGDWAFEDCGSLTSVTIPDGVTSIGDYAFYGCSKIKVVNYDGNIESWLGIEFASSSSNPCYNGSNLYFNGELVTDVVIPDNVKRIGYCAFQGVSSLTSVTIPTSVKSIDGCAFLGCSSLASVTIPNSVTSIGSSAFAGCSSLTSVTIPDSVTSIGSGAFSSCSSLTSVTIPDRVTSIGDYAFFNCSSLTSVTIPDRVTSIGGRAFSDCSSLVSVKIPDSAKNIRYSAFYGCRNIKNVYYNGDVGSWLGINFEGATSNPCYYGSNLYFNGELATDVAIPDDMTMIGDYAFCGCDSLTSVTIPNSVTSVGRRAFSYCRSLESVMIPDSVTDIGYGAFCRCYSLLNVAIPNSVTDVGWEVFAYCRSLTSVMITDGVKNIGDRTFYGCSSLNNIELPSSVTSVGNSAFSNCNSLNSVKMPNTVRSIGYNAFENCTSLTKMSIPKSVTSIGRDTFSNCGSLTSVTIPDSVMSIDDSAFNGCGALTDIAFGGTKDAWKKVGYVGFTPSVHMHYSCSSLDGHYIPIEIDKADCASTGQITYLCSCGYEYTETLPNAHDYVFVNSFEPTCSAHGYDLYKCSKCGTEKKDYKNDELKEHSYVVTIVEPTCTTGGYTLHKCSACGYSYKDELVQPLGHSETNAEAKAPTCTEAGHTAGTCCSRCGKIMSGMAEIAALGHDFGEWKQTKAPTCTEKGTETRTCTRCNAFEIRDVAPTDHHYTAAVTAPTCTAQGYTTYTCSCGDSYVADYKDALGHSFGEWTVTTAPTCTEKGVETRYCSRCDVTETRDVDALGHSYKNGTCTRCGEKDTNYVAAPVIKITTSAGKPKLTWSKVDGATKYYIYRSTDGKNYKQYTSTLKTSYTNTSTTIGTTYYYKVKAAKVVNGKKVYSLYSNGESVKCVPAAPVVSIYRTNGKPQLKWNAVIGATKYWIYRSTDGVNFSYYDSTTKTSYTNSGAASGTKYYYRVKAVAVVNGTNATSANSNTKSLMTTLAKPTVSITTSNGMPKITWKAVTGADKYYVYRSTDGKIFRYYDSTTMLSYTNTGAKKNTKYYYKVKAICSANTNANSAYSAVVSIKATK